MKFCKVIYLFLLLQSYIQGSCTFGDFTQVPGSPFAAGADPQQITFSPVVSGGLFAAVPNEVDNTVSVYSVNQTTGEFMPVAGPFFTDVGPTGIAYSPIVNNQLFAAVSNFTAGTVSVYSVNQTTGVFMPVAGSPFVSGNGPATIAFTPLLTGGLFAAVPNVIDHTLSIYSVDQTTGVFTPIAGSPFFAAGNPFGIAFSPIVNGNLFAAITDTAGAVRIYSVDQTTGVFTLVSTAVEGGIFLYVAFSPVVSGNLYVAASNFTANEVFVYSVDTTSGALTAVPGSPFATGGNPEVVAFSPAFGQNLFAGVVNSADNTVSVYSVDENTGAFTQLDHSPFATELSPIGFAFSPIVSNNLFAAAANSNSDNVSVYSVCLPIPTPSSPIQPPSSIQAIAACDIFLTQVDLINIIRWQAPTSGPAPTRYLIFRNATLTDFVATVLASQQLQFVDHNIQPNISYTYYIVAKNDTAISSPSSVTICRKC